MSAARMKHPARRVRIRVLAAGLALLLGACAGLPPTQTVQLGGQREQVQRDEQLTVQRRQGQQDGQRQRVLEQVQQRGEPQWRHRNRRLQ